MNVRTSRWRWAFLAVLALAAAGVVVFMTSHGRLQAVGVGIFVVAGIGYLAVRVAMILEDRRR